MSGFWRAVYHSSTTDLLVDDLDVSDCDYAFECNTIGNVFLSDVNIADCNNGLYLADAGILVTSGVVATNTPNAFVGTIPQILSPQIGLAGFSFDENSYCVVPGGYTFAADATFPALPIRINDDYPPVVIPEGISVTMPAGSRLSNWLGGEYRMLEISGSLTCTSTALKLWTYSDRHVITLFG